MENDGTVVEIPLSNGEVALVSLEDAGLVSGYRWRLAFPRKRNKYAYAWYNGKVIYMHRIIVGLAPNDPREVDHRDNNGLNNQRYNLRIATHSQNIANSRGYGRSRFRGVMIDERYTIPIYVELSRRSNGIRQRFTIRGFSTEEEAAMCYNVIARRVHGEFAFQNQVDMG